MKQSNQYQWIVRLFIVMAMLAIISSFMGCEKNYTERCQRYVHIATKDGVTKSQIVNFQDLLDANGIENYFYFSRESLFADPDTQYLEHIGSFECEESPF